MQVTETKSESLSREFQVAVPAAAIEEKVVTRLKEIAKTAQLPGFRPGKVPVGLLRKRYGPNVMGEVLEQAVNESSSSVMTERGLRPALQPRIEITKFDEGQDLEYTMNVEVLPEIEMGDFGDLKLERLVAEPDPKDLDEALERIAKANRTAETVTEDRPAENGDIVVIDFEGFIDGEAFPGGKAEAYPLELGSGAFIPGFEEQLVGAKAGDEKEVKVSFPEEYGAADLAGKDALFQVKVAELRASKPADIDDELAKKVGLDDLEALKARIREDHLGEYKTLSRNRLKRDLLDSLAKDYQFEVPNGLVEQEFEAIWNQYQEHLKQGGEEDPEDAEKSEDEKKAEFREIAERRVRLGLLLAEVGRSNNLQVSPDDLNRAMMAEARNYPGQEQAVLEYFQNNPQAREGLTAPIFEDKVVDFLIEMAQVTDKTVSIEDLVKDPDEDGDEGDEKKAAKPKKAAAKKPAAKKKAPAKKKADDESAAEDGDAPE
ncbi:MAG: trigger factor [Rhodobacterales bacterium]|nr:trigger factor [Rhodobacterales bacterium]